MFLEGKGGYGGANFTKQCGQPYSETEDYELKERITIKVQRLIMQISVLWALA